MAVEQGEEGRREARTVRMPPTLGGGVEAVCPVCGGEATETVWLVKGRFCCGAQCAETRTYQNL